MSVIDFKDLPDSSRLWIYGAARPLSDQEVRQLREQMSQFMEQWTAHKRELRTGWELRYNRFILIGVDESMMNASGCSIDDMVRNLRAFEQQIGVDIVDSHAKVFFRDRSGEIQCVPRTEFKQLVEKGQITENTIGFNNIIQTAGELRASKWEAPMKETWHRQAFGIAA